GGESGLERRCAGAGRVPQSTQSKNVLDRLEQRVVVGRRGELRAGPSSRPGHDRRDVTSRSEAAATCVARSLIPREEQQTGWTERAQERRDERGQEAASRRDRGDAP